MCERGLVLKNEVIFFNNGGFLGTCSVFSAINIMTEEVNIIESKYENMAKSVSSLLTSRMNHTIWEIDFN